LPLKKHYCERRQAIAMPDNLEQAGNNPVLNTERLDLAWLTLDDAPMMLAVWNDPAFMRYVGDRGVRTLEQAREVLDTGLLKLYAEYGYGPFRVRRREDGADLGICGLFRRDGLDEPDIGFAILPEYCGRGYAFEASVAVLDHARDVLRLPCVTAIVSPQNEASIGLLEKLGLRFERPVRMPADDHDVSLYRIDFLS
jgi:RimJ/RimL family protein N-acetyltransferase